MKRGWPLLVFSWACSSTIDKPTHITGAASDTSAADGDTGKKAEEDTAATSPEEPGPDTATGTIDIDRPAADLTADEVAQAMGGTLASGIPDPLSARAAYIDALSHRDTFCPGGGDLSIIGEWEGCLASSGWRFAGYTEYTGPTERDAVESFHLLADFRFHDPDGALFIGGGELDLTMTTDGGDRSWTSDVSGTFSYPGAENWMSTGGGSAVLQTTGSWAGSVWSLQLDGSIASDVHGLHLQAITASSESCDGQPSGQLKLRDASGYWYTMDATCGCGPIQFAEEEDLGSACVDARAPLDALAMEMRP